MVEWKAIHSHTHQHLVSDTNIYINSHMWAKCARKGSTREQKRISRWDSNLPQVRHPSDLSVQRDSALPSYCIQVLGRRAMLSVRTVFRGWQHRSWWATAAAEWILLLLARMMGRPLYKVNWDTSLCVCFCVVCAFAVESKCVDKFRDKETLSLTLISLYQSCRNVSSFSDKISVWLCSVSKDRAYICALDICFVLNDMASAVFNLKPISIYKERVRFARVSKYNIFNYFKHFPMLFRTAKNATCGTTVLFETSRPTELNQTELWNLVLNFSCGVRCSVLRCCIVCWPGHDSEH